MINGLPFQNGEMPNKYYLLKNIATEWKAWSAEWKICLRISNTPIYGWINTSSMKSNCSNKRMPLALLSIERSKESKHQLSRWEDLNGKNEEPSVIFLKYFTFQKKRFRLINLECSTNWGPYFYNQCPKMKKIIIQSVRT